jgi:hypothetical protein
VGLMPKSVAWRIAISLGVALVIALAVRLATDPDDPVTTEPAGVRGVPGGPALVTSADFEGVGASSPGAVVLRWWQAIQFRRPVRRVADYYAATSRPKSKDLRADLKLARYIFDSTKPRVLDQRTDGGTAQVFTIIPPADDVASTEGQPYVFELEREGESWRLADTYLADRADAERTTAAESRRR